MGIERRELLAGAGVTSALAATGALAGALVAKAHDPAVDAYRRWLPLYEEWCAKDDEDFESWDAWKRYFEKEWAAAFELANAEATTLHGLACQAALAVRLVAHGTFKDGGIAPQPQYQSQWADNIDGKVVTSMQTALRRMVEAQP